jgi:colanic acid biosynthesis glycosyl transferase WcaI
MRVVVWGINYAPEFAGIAPHNVALCEFLASNGHEVQMVTSFPYYPSWEKLLGDRGQLYRSENINGVSVHRCWQFVPKRVSALNRILHEASFVITSTLRVFFLPRADVYIVISPPLLLGVSGWLVGIARRAPFVFHVQDLQPDAALRLGMLQGSWFGRVLYGLESFAYRHATRVSGITRGMLKIFRSKGVPESKLIYFPNAVALNHNAESACERGEFRNRHDFAPDEFLAVYAGNLGVKQGLEVLLDAGSLLCNPRIKIVICGDGAQRESLEQRVEELKLPNVRMLPLQAGRDYRCLLVDADICLITQRLEAGNSFFPSKLLGLLAESKPVITVAAPESELALSVGEGKFGVNIPPDHPQELADLFTALAQDPRRLAEYGVAGRCYVEQFEKTQVMQGFAETLSSLCQG